MTALWKAAEDDSTNVRLHGLRVLAQLGGGINRHT